MNFIFQFYTVSSLGLAQLDIAKATLKGGQKINILSMHYMLPLILV